MLRAIKSGAAGRLLVVTIMAMPLLLGAGGSWGCGREYSQATPEEVIQSARAMVENGDVHRLPDLIYAESAEMRTLLKQFGPVLGSLQSLALELHKTYPEEIAEIRAQTEAAAAKGEATGLVGRMLGQAAPARRPAGARGGRRNVTVSAGPGGVRAGGGGEMQQSFNEAAKELFADPYGWLKRSEGRLTTQQVTDDVAAIMWDGKPAFGIGLLMKEEKGKWYITVPTTMPGMGRLAPSSADMWQIAGSLATALDNAIKDTQREVQAGKHPTLEHLAQSVGEKAAIPAIAIMYAYQRAMREEREQQRASQGTREPAAPGK